MSSLTKPLFHLCSYNICMFICFISCFREQPGGLKALAAKNTGMHLCSNTEENDFHNIIGCTTNLTIQNAQHEMNKIHGSLKKVCDIEQIDTNYGCTIEIEEVPLNDTLEVWQHLEYTKKGFLKDARQDRVKRFVCGGFCVGFLVVALAASGGVILSFINSQMAENQLQTELVFKSQLKEIRDLKKLATNTNEQVKELEKLLHKTIEHLYYENLIRKVKTDSASFSSMIEQSFVGIVSIIMHRLEITGMFNFPSQLLKLYPNLKYFKHPEIAHFQTTLERVSAGRNCCNSKFAVKLRTYTQDQEAFIRIGETSLRSTVNINRIAWTTSRSLQKSLKTYHNDEKLVLNRKVITLENEMTCNFNTDGSFFFLNFDQVTATLACPFDHKTVTEERSYISEKFLINNENIGVESPTAKLNMTKTITKVVIKAGQNLYVPINCNLTSSAFEVWALTTVSIGYKTIAFSLKDTHCHIWIKRHKKKLEGS